MTAAPRLGKKENTISPSVAGDKLPDLLKVAAIYGGNASGKSSLILALAMVGKLANRQPDSTSSELPVQPFRFDKELLDKPSTFESHFIAQGVRYQFLVGATRQRITDEVLIAYPRGKETLLYSRHHVNDVDVYEFGNLFEVDRVVRDVWQKVTGPKSLFISQAVANSSEDLQQLRRPFQWLSSGAFVLSDGSSQLQHLGEHAPGQADARRWVAPAMSAFLREIDVPVSNIVWEMQEEGASERDSQESQSKKSGSQGALRKAKVTLTHETKLGAADFDLSEESSGTRSLMGFWLPACMLTGLNGAIRESPDTYGIIIVDELDASLHPEAVEHLVRMHIRSGAHTQLIFTTHDTHLMSTKLLRRDQLWITDRNSNGATRLFSIHSFKGRESEDVEKRYFEGRYRGLPIRRRT